MFVNSLLMFVEWEKCVAFPELFDDKSKHALNSGNIFPCRWLKEQKKLNIFVEPRVKSELMAESSYYSFVQTWQDGKLNYFYNSGNEILIYFLFTYIMKRDRDSQFIGNRLRVHQDVIYNLLSFKSIFSFSVCLNFSSIPPVIFCCLHHLSIYDLWVT